MHGELLINGFFVGGPCDSSVGKAIARSPWDGSVVGTYAEGGLSEARTAIECAHTAFQTWRRSPRHERVRLLRRAAQLVHERESELADLACKEIGKPIRWARAEVSRLRLTFELAANELQDFGLERLPADLDPRGEDARLTVERVPRGVVFCVVPYNWPYNLAAHKIAPALATGNTVMVKPSGQAALCTLALCRILHEAGFPPGTVNAVAMPASIAERALAHPLVAAISFTGSPQVGWKLKEKFWNRHVTLELGSDSQAIVLEDADLDWAARRCAEGAYGYAGQVCISVQHVRVARRVFEDFRERFVAATQATACGNPAQEETVCGPLISSSAADRFEEAVEEAVAGGAKVLVRGVRQGNMVPPVLLEDVPAGCRLAKEEAFGPVACLSAFDSDEEAISKHNASAYGIHTGLFTDSLARAEYFYQNLETGGLIVNDYPTLRLDHMPYGGVKQSGFGREGIRYAMEELTEPKSLLIRPRRTGT
jgi:acyl-CoA reductase-like NAD-dependent aldehyde dehydrogenase